MSFRLASALSLVLLSGCAKQIETGLGGEALFVNFKGESTTRPALQMETRIMPPPDQPFGPVTRIAVSFHDATIIQEAADWYTQKDGDALLRLVMLWPGMLMTPLLGSKATQAFGLRFRFGDGRYVPSIEGGFQTSLWTHFSTKQMPFDLCFGTWGSFQLSLGEEWGIGMRSTFDFPTYHTLAGLSEGIYGGSVVVTWVTRPGKRRTQNAPPPPPPPTVLPPPTAPDPIPPSDGAAPDTTPPTEPLEDE